MELETKEEKLASVQREIEDLTFGGKTEEEIGALKRIKHDLENKCHDQEEELDELAGQVQVRNYNITFIIIKSFLMLTVICK